MDLTIPCDYGPETETRLIGGKEYEILYVDKTDLPDPRAYGYAFIGTNIVHIRKDLNERVKAFVLAHELYHLRDLYSWGGAFGSELRANVLPGIRDPLGLIATVWATLKDPDRRQFYWERMMGRK